MGIRTTFSPMGGKSAGLPGGGRAVEWIAQSTDATVNYISIWDTVMPTNVDWVVSADFAVPSEIVRNGGYPFVCTINANGGNGYFSYRNWGGKLNISYSLDSVCYPTDFSLVYHGEMGGTANSYNAFWRVTQNGTSILNRGVNRSDYDFRAFSRVTLLGGTTSGTTVSSCVPGIKIYSASMTIGGTKVRDLIPAVVGGAACLYDTISKSYFTNSGTGAFTAGPYV